MARRRAEAEEHAADELPGLAGETAPAGDQRGVQQAGVQAGITLQHQEKRFRIGNFLLHLFVGRLGQREQVFFFCFHFDAEGGGIVAQRPFAVKAETVPQVAGRDDFFGAVFQRHFCQQPVVDRHAVFAAFLPNGFQFFRIKPSYGITNRVLF